MNKLPTKPGFHQINPEEYLDELYQYDYEIFDIKPISFPFESPAEFKKYLLEEHQSEVYILNNEENLSVGYFSYEICTDLPNMVELTNMGVLPKYQNQGFGSKLMKKYLEIVGDRDSRHATHPDSNSRFLYEKFGYRRVKIIENYFGDGQPRVMYFRPGII